MHTLVHTKKQPTYRATTLYVGCNAHIQVVAQNSKKLTTEL